MANLTKLQEMATLVTQYELREEEMDRIRELDDRPQTAADAELIKKYNTWTAYYNEFNRMNREAMIQSAERGDDGAIEGDGFLTRDQVRELYPNANFATVKASDALHKQLSEDTFYYNPYPEDGWFALTETGALGVGEGSVATVQDRIGTVYASPEEAKGVSVPFGLADDVTYHSDRRGAVTGRTNAGGVLKGGINTDVANNIYRHNDIIPMGAKFLGPEDDTSNVVQIGFSEVFGIMTPVVMPVRGRAISVEEGYEVPTTPTVDPIGLEIRGYDEDAPPEIYDSDYDSFEEGDPDKTKGETRETEPGSTPTDRVKDPLFAANLLANIGKGLEGWNLEGVNIPIPSYEQPRYQSGQIGPAVQNLFRGR